jgi:hypothetical protein
MVFSIDNDVLTSNGWKRPKDITFNDWIATLVNGYLVYVPHIGISFVDYKIFKSYLSINDVININVSMGHRIYSRTLQEETYTFRPINEIINKPTIYLKTAVNGIHPSQEHLVESKQEAIDMFNGLEDNFITSNEIQADYISRLAIHAGYHCTIEPIKENNQVSSWHVKTFRNDAHIEALVDIDKDVSVFERIFEIKGPHPPLDIYFEIVFDTEYANRPVYLRRYNKGCWQ